MQSPFKYNIFVVETSHKPHGQANAQTLGFGLPPMFATQF